jgi:hypothetical protein
MRSIILKLPLIYSRRFFPPTEFDLKGEEREEVEGGDLAETGAVKANDSDEVISEAAVPVEKAKVEDLPDVPTNEPSDDGPPSKKQKPSHTGSL